LAQGGGKFRSKCTAQTPIYIDELVVRDMNAAQTPWPTRRLSMAREHHNLPEDLSVDTLKNLDQCSTQRRTE